MHKIDWCEGGLQLAYIGTNNIGENYLNSRIKCTTVRLYKWEKHLYNRGDRIQDSL